VHLGGNNSSGQNTTTDGNETSEGALFICGDGTSVFHPHRVCASSSTF
jgi:hypothetical protein